MTAEDQPASSAIAERRSTDLAEPAVRYQDVSFTFPPRDGAPGVSVLDHITLDVRPGERLGILGPNGGGKSTLLKLTLGLLTGYTGRIRVMGLEPAQARRRRLIGYVPQRIEAELRFPLSARQVVQMAATAGLSPWRGPGPGHRAAIDDSLGVVGASAFADKPIGELSGGQVQRIMIARALACHPKVLLLDEPTVGIDVSGQKQFADLLSRLHDRLGLTIIVVSHDIRTVAAGCDRVACLSRTLHYHVAPEGLTPAVLAEVFRHDVAAIFGDLHVDAHKASACKDPTHHHGSAPPPGA